MSSRKRKGGKRQDAAQEVTVEGDAAPEFPLEEDAAPAPAELLHEPAPVPVAVDHPSAAVTIQGDVTIAPNATVHESVHVTGTVIVGRDARITGMLTALQDATVGENADLESGAEVHGTLMWERGAQAARVRAHGAFITADGRVRATSLTARRGIRAGPPARDAQGVMPS